MKHYYALFIAVILPFLSFGQYNSENLKLSRSEANEDENAVNVTTASPPAIAQANLKLYPIFATPDFVAAHRDLGKFTTLRDAQAKGWVTITEHVGAGAAQPQLVNRNDESPRSLENNEAVENNRPVVEQQVRTSETVNKLYIENVSNDTVYIMAGEVVKGGKQDRVIAQDMVLPPHSGKIDLSVFCVEHGRWTYKNGNNSGFTTAGYMAPQSVRKEVDVAQSQSAVWGKVSEVNMANNTSSHSDALTANENNEAYQAKLKSYLDHAGMKGLATDPMVVGVVAVSGDKVIGCDIFATHQLFEAQYPALLHSYASEAVMNGQPVSMSDAQVSDYLARLLDESRQTQELSGSGKAMEVKTQSGQIIKTRITKF